MDSPAAKLPADKTSGSHRLRFGRAAQVGILFVLAVILLFARPPDQFLHPALWVKDTVVLQSYAAHGWWSILEPVQCSFINSAAELVTVHGYYIIASKLIALIALKTSLLWAPQIELLLIATFTCAVVVAVALSPTYLPWHIIYAPPVG